MWWAEYNPANPPLLYLSMVLGKSFLILYLNPVYKMRVTDQ